MIASRGFLTLVALALALVVHMAGDVDDVLARFSSNPAEAPKTPLFDDCELDDHRLAPLHKGNVSLPWCVPVGASPDEIDRLLTRTKGLFAFLREEIERAKAPKSFRDYFRRAKTDVDAAAPEYGVFRRVAVVDGIDLLNPTVVRESNASQSCSEKPRADEGAITRKRPKSVAVEYWDVREWDLKTGSPKTATVEWSGRKACGFYAIRDLLNRS